MTNEFLEAARSSDDSSSDRYEKLKKEEAGTGQTEAEKRFQELKEEAKREFIEEKRKEEQEDEEESEEEEDDKFITH